MNNQIKIRNTAFLDFNDKNLDNVRFAKVNNLPAVRKQLRLKCYVDDANYHSVHESSFSKLDPNETLKLDEQDSIFLNSTLISQKTIKELPTKSYVDSLHENSGNRQDLSTVFNDQDNEFDKNKITN